MIPLYRPIYSIPLCTCTWPVVPYFFLTLGMNSLVAKLSSGEPGVPGSSTVVSTSGSTSLSRVRGFTDFSACLKSKRYSCTK